MTFKIEIPANTYKNWNSYNEWSRNHLMNYDWTTALGLVAYLRQNCPEIVDISNVNFYADKDASRNFEFESEVHYHFFLLKQ